MKRNLWLAPLAITLAFGACNGDLIEQPTAFLTTDTFYKTSTDLESGLLSVYSSLRTALNVSSLSTWGTDNMSDEAAQDVGETVTTYILSNQLFWSATEGNTTDVAWGNMYTLIYRANLVIEKAPGVTMNEATKAIWVAEAKFLRGYAYLHLTKRYSGGNATTDLDVPLLLTLADHAAPEIKRSTTAAVHAQIIKDLTDAEAALPLTQTGTLAGRVTKGAAQMALADLYNWRSSFLKTGEWQKAADAAKKLIDAGIYGLNDNYYSTYLPTNKGNKEIILRIVAAADNRASTSYVNAYFPRSFGFSPVGGGFGQSQPTAWMLSSFAPGDYRGTVGPVSDTVGFRTTGILANGTLRTTTPHVWKYRPSNLDNALGDVDVPLYRYAEAVLFYGEAQIELGNVSGGIQTLNLIRARARKGTGAQTRTQPADLSASLSAGAAREAVFQERNWELAFENKRWFDLVRRDSEDPGYFKSELTAHDPAATVRGPVNDARKRFPVPGTEIERMPSLVQNPNY